VWGALPFSLFTVHRGEEEEEGEPLDANLVGVRPRQKKFVVIDILRRLGMKKGVGS